MKCFKSSIRLMEFSGSKYFVCFDARISKNVRKVLYEKPSFPGISEEKAVLRKSST